MMDGIFNETLEKYNHEIGEFNEKHIFGQELKNFSSYILDSTAIAEFINDYNN